MDFSEREKVVTSTPVPRSEPSPRESEVTAWFARGIALEEDPNTQPEAHCRLPSGARDPAESCRGAHQSGHALLQPPGFLRSPKNITARPSNPIRATRSPTSTWATCSTKPGRVNEAIQTYKTALQLAPTYADAHYNLALAYEKSASPARPSNTGSPTSSSIPPGPGRCTPAARSNASCRPMG